MNLITFILYYTYPAFLKLHEKMYYMGQADTVPTISNS